MSKSWTPEKIKDRAAARYRGQCIGWGIACCVLAFLLAGTPLSGCLLIMGGVLFFIASQIKVWKPKKGEVGIY